MNKAVEQMNTQLDIFSQPATGTELRDIGISRAKNNAERQSPGWSETAYNFFINYAKNIGKPFMTNDVVLASSGIVPDTEDKRAWGQIPVKAQRAGLIVWLDYKRGENPKHNKNPRSLWEWRKSQP